MPWFWVVAVLVFWTVVVFAVIALCISVRQIDARLGRDRRAIRYTTMQEPQAGPEAKVE